MAYKNKKICNHVTKQDIQFLQVSKDTDGELLEMESTYNSFSKEPTSHYHPYQQENFKVLAGELTVRIDGKLRVLKAGETLHIAKNQVHAMWNNTNSKTVINWQVRPAMNTEALLETSAGLANDGKTNENGMPNILQVALMVNRYSKVFRLAKPSFAIQKIVFFILTPFAYLMGYKPSYKKYID